MNVDLYIGLYLNVEGEGEPYYMIGIKSANNFEVIEEKVRLALLKQFRKDVFFQFLNLNLKEYNELGTPLLEQGVHFSI